MAETDSKKPLLVWLALALFLLLGLPAIYLFKESQLVDFDPRAKLLDAAIQKNFESDLKSELEALFSDISGTAFHITQDGCFCHMVAESHVSQVKQQITDEGFGNTVVSLAEHPQFERFLPSTPAVVIFTESGDLLYIGPYSTGYLCMPGNGLVEELISRMGQNTGDKIIMSIANGCYCNID